MPIVSSSLTEQQVAVVGPVLQRTLVDLIDLAVLGKHLHWNTVGPRFLSVHPHLDEVIDTARDLYDTVAERMAGIGFPPDGRVQTVSRDTPLGVAPEGYVAVPDVVSIVAGALGVVGARSAEGARQLGEVDIVSQDVLIEVSRAVDKDAWMMQAEGERVASSAVQALSAEIRRGKALRRR